LAPAEPPVANVDPTATSRHRAYAIAVADRAVLGHPETKSRGARRPTNLDRPGAQAGQRRRLSHPMGGHPLRRAEPSPQNRIGSRIRIWVPSEPPFRVRIPVRAERLLIASPQGRIDATAGERIAAGPGGHIAIGATPSPSAATASARPSHSARRQAARPDGEVGRNPSATAAAHRRHRIDQLGGRRAGPVSARRAARSA